MAASRAFAEKAPCGDAGKIPVFFSVKACWATSLYARMHSSTVMPNLPSMIAMMLDSWSLRHARTGGQLALPSSACATDQVEDLARSGGMVEAHGIAELLHNFLQDKEARYATDAASVYTQSARQTLVEPAQPYREIGPSGAREEPMAAIVVSRCTGQVVLCL